MIDVAHFKVRYYHIITKVSKDQIEKAVKFCDSCGQKNQWTKVEKQPSSGIICYFTTKIIYKG